MEAADSQTLQAAAEEVREHLVSLRGGAPFLSATDADVLLTWFDDGRSVAEILTALEMAAEDRVKKRSRVPLSLTHARKHLKKTAERFAAHVHARTSKASMIGGASAPNGDRPSCHPLKPIIDDLGIRAARDRRPILLKTLAAELFILPQDDPEGLMEGGLRSIRAFMIGTWNGLTEDDRNTRCAQAQVIVKQNAPKDEATLVRLSEEIARGALRKEYPLLSASSLWDLVVA